jgi:hypothetical protein
MPRGIREPAAERFQRFIAKSDGCWIWTGGRDQKGYGCFAGRKAHRWSWELHNGPIPPGMLACHHCDNPPCVNPAHLFLGTAKDNSADMVAKGRVKRPCLGKKGADGHNAKLTDDDVREIRRLSALGLSTRKIGHRFGVSKFPVSEILRGKTWAHVT